jgi:hypothetical protein
MEIGSAVRTLLCSGDCVTQIVNSRNFMSARYKFSGMTERPPETVLARKDLC